VEDRNKPKITNPEVANIINLTKLIGSKLWEGDTAKETAGPTKMSTEEIFFIINSLFIAKLYLFKDQKTRKWIAFSIKATIQNVDLVTKNIESN